MKKYLMVIANYPDSRQEFFMKYMSPRNKEYCNIHNVTYLEYTTPVNKFRNNYTWLKFTIVKNLIDTGFLNHGDILTHFDADMCMVNPTIEYPATKSFNYSIDSGNTHCMGSYSIIVNDWTTNLINLILDDTRFSMFKDKLEYHGYFQQEYNFWEVFREQASWYSLAGIVPHSNTSFWDLPNFGWHSNYIDGSTVYSVNELYEHVEILPTAWNVTELEGESNCIFNINKTKKEDVIMRHFAGGQEWRKEWF
jgi:hypothetical protein